MARAAGAEAVVNAVAVELGGSFSAEHGIGQSKRHAMATHKDPVALDVMRAVKAAIDPREPDEPGQGAAMTAEPGRRRLRVYLSHAPEARAKYYGDEALAGLREAAEVRLNESGRDLSGRELAEAAAGLRRSSSPTACRTAPPPCSRTRRTSSPFSAAPWTSATWTWRRRAPRACW